jgi:DNA invertase Pin-like site-specific DNA recombinase
VADDRRTGGTGTQPYGERTGAGIKDAQRRGKFGRKPKLTALQIDLARKQIERGEDKGKVAESFNVNRTTLCRALAD